MTGAPGYINSGLLNGMSFVEGWQSNFFISKWTMQQLVCLIACPSISSTAPVYVVTMILPFEEELKVGFLFQLIECPSIYELLASSTYHWEETPLLQIWRERLDDNGKKSALLESYGPAESIKMIAKSLSEHEVSLLQFFSLYNLIYCCLYS
jgi:hypothetical protein